MSRMQWTKWMRVATSVLGVGFLFVVLTGASCNGRGYIDQCDPHYDPSQGSCVRGGVIISFSQTGAGSVSAHSLAITREADPDLLAYAGGSATGSVTVTLANGTKRTYTTNLVYSPSRSAFFAASTPGHQVYAFVPANPSSLQSFIDQYRSQAKNVTVDSKVYLDNQSAGSDTAVVAVQEEHDGSQSYIGSIGVSVGAEEEHQDF